MGNASEPYQRRVLHPCRTGLPLIIAHIAGKIRKNRDTVFEWRKAHPEFDEACKIGIAAATYFWEEKLSSLASTGKGNATACVFGRTPPTRRLLYVATDGGFFKPYPGTEQAARLVEIDLR